MNRHRNQDKRAKHGAVPGDYGKAVKIRMLEKFEPFFAYGVCISRACIKAFRKAQYRRATIKARQRARDERFKALIEASEEYASPFSRDDEGVE